MRAKRPDLLYPAGQQPPAVTHAERDDMLQRPMPHDLESERAILGAIILNNDLIVEAASGLVCEDFYVRAHQYIYKAMLALNEKGQPIDPILIGNQLKQEAMLEGVGGFTFISELTYGLPHFASLKEYVKLVRNKAALRQLIKVASKTISEALEGESDATAIVTRAEEQVLAVVNDMHRGSLRSREGFYSLDELQPEFKARIEAYHRHETRAITTGMREVDEMLDGGGLQPQGLYFVGATAKAGKTSLALGWAYHIAKNLNQRVLVISEEMHRLSLMQRIYSSHAGVPYFMFRPGFYGAEYDLAMEKLSEFSKLPLRITDNLFTVSQIRRHCRREVQTAPPQQRVGLIIVDYLQLVGLNDEGNDWKQRAQQVGAVSREIKRMGQELDVPVLAMSALNRDSAREGRRPEMHDLRESGQLEFDAEAIFFLHNPNYKPGVAYQRQDVEDIDLIVGAQRNGPVGDIRMKFIGKFMQFLTEADYMSIQASGHATPNTKQQDEETSSLWA